MKASFFRLALILGLVSAIGPFAIDMYLPALPTIGVHLNANPARMQMTIMAFMLSTGIFQVFYGPAADMFGRKPPLYFGLVLFAIGSIGCALAPNIQTLIAFRVIEGLGACAGAVVPRAIVRDLHTGPEATRLMSLLMLVFSVSPLLAPVTGAFITEAFGWRGVFFVVTGASVLGLIMVMTQLEETRPMVDQEPMGWRKGLVSTLGSFGLLLRDARFLGLVFVGSFGIAAFFIYIGNSSYVFIDHFGQSRTAYGLLFALNAASFIGAAQFNARLTSRFGLVQVVRVCTLGFALASGLLAALTLLGMDSLPAMVGLLFISFAFLGVVVPTSSVLAMEAHGEIAGAASALMGALQVVAGSAAMGLVGLFADKTSLPMVVGIAGAAAVSFLIGLFALRPQQAPVA